MYKKNKGFGILSKVKEKVFSKNDYINFLILNKTINMRIIDIEDDLNEFIHSELVEYYKNKKLILFIGSGFTKGERTKYKAVPDVDETIELMKNLICKFQTQISISELENLKLQELSDYFFRFVPRNEVNKFLNDYFVNVELCNSKREFVNLDWQSIYTLNIDDAIERNSKFSEILPYKKLNRDFLNENVFKLHGDAKYETIYAEEQTIIFSSQQYIKSLIHNTSILSCFNEDYLSKNIIFIGCGLKNEIDINYIIEKSDIKSAKNSVERIYITLEKPNFLKSSDLENFGVTTILVVEDYQSFYQKIVDSFQNIEFDIYENIDKFKNVIIEKNKDKSYSIDFLSGTKELILNNSNIAIPAIFTERTVTKSILKSVLNSCFTLIIGKRVSGKTFVCTDIIDKTKNKSTYFFPSNISISDNDLDQLLKQNNIIVVFDTNSLTYENLAYLFDKRSLINSSNIHVLIALNSSDRLLMSIPYANDEECEIFEINSIFNPNEIVSFNENVNRFGFISFNAKKNILENVYNYRDIYKKDLNNELENIAIKLNDIDLKVLILSASNDKVYSSIYRLLKIKPKELDRILSKIANGSIIEKEYDIANIESFQHASYKTIINSKSYVFSLLGTYVTVQRGSIAILTDIITELVVSLLKDIRFENTYKNIISFDNLNQIFQKKEGGVINLIFHVYEKLEPFLYEENHFWTQRAKSIYHLKREDKKHLEEAVIYAKKPYYDSKAGSRLQLHSSLLISMLYGRIVNVDNYKDVGLLKESINWYYIALQENSTNDKVINNFLDKAKYNKTHNDFSSLCKHLIGYNIQFDKKTDEMKSYLVNRLLNWHK